MVNLGSHQCTYNYGEYRVNTYQGNHSSSLKSLIYQEATELVINGRAKSETIAINQCLTYCF